MVSYNLGSSPFWYFADNSGKALVGGYLWSFSASNPNLLKSIYSDPNGINAYPNPIPILGTGFVEQFSNMYFADDDNYYLAVTMSATSPSPPLYYSDQYNPSGNGGGGGGSTIYINIDNLITNGQFLFNYSQNSATAITTTLTTLAPSNHNGLTTPDIVLRKDSTASTETINFLPFNQGSAPPGNPTQTPRYYLEYSCTSASTETQKDIEFPISAHVRTLETQVVTAGFWARSSTTSQVETFVTQYFGDGNNGASSPASSSPDLIFLSTIWTLYTVNITIPSTAGKTIGNCGNDYLVFSISCPLGQVFNIDVTNVFFINGVHTSDYPYNTQDQTSSIIYSPRTGDTKLAFDNAVIAAFGWLPMQDGTIGSSTSGATNRANIDTYPLYLYLWTNVSQPSSNVYCPVIGGIGGSASADFAANKPLTLSKVLGRALAGAGTGAGLTNRPLGSFLGEETHLLNIAEMPAHQHNTFSSGAGAFGENAPTGGRNSPNDAGTSSVTGGGGAHNNMQPTTFMNVYIKI